MRYMNLYSVNRIQEDLLFQKNRRELKPKAPLAEKVYDLNLIDSNCKLCYAWLGHSSIYIQMNGYKILMDPVFSQCLSPIPPLGPHRFPGPVPQRSDFPDLDVILISHSHHDHLDLKTIKMLKEKTKCFVVPLGIKKILKRCGVEENRIIELNWNEEFHLNKLTIHCTSAHHNSTRCIFDTNKTLWCSYVIEDENHRIFYSGDSAFSEHFYDIALNFSGFDLAFMECGQYGKLWHSCHMFPEESVNACQILQAKCSIPVHWGAYVLSSHNYDEPAKRFERKALEEKINFKIPKLYKIESIE